MFNDYREERIRRAKAADRQRRNREAYANHIKGLAVWDWFATITFSQLPSRDTAIASIKRYLRGIEKAAGNAIGWVMVEDFGQLGGRLHAHILIAGVDHLDRQFWWHQAYRRFGRSEIKQYEPDEGGDEYLAQHALSETGNIHFGGGRFPDGAPKGEHAVGRVVIAPSANVPSHLFHQTLGRRRQK
jgi:hypothetical protein